MILCTAIFVFNCLHKNKRHSRIGHAFCFQFEYIVRVKHPPEAIAGEMQIKKQILRCAQDDSPFTVLRLLFAAFASLGLFGFHGFLQLFALLGTGFCALLTLLVENSLGSEELEKGLFGAVSALESTAHNAQITAISVAITRGYGVKKAGYGIAGLKERKSLTPRMQVALLAQGDQLFHVRTDGFRLGDGRLDTVFQNDGRDQVAQQSAAVAGVASEFESCIAVAHGESLYLIRSQGAGCSLVERCTLSAVPC
jgi:hypothetical protein